VFFSGSGSGVLSFEGVADCYEDGDEEKARDCEGEFGCEGEVLEIVGVFAHVRFWLLFKYSKRRGESQAYFVTFVFYPKSLVYFVWLLVLLSRIVTGPVIGLGSRGYVLGSR